MDQFQRSEAFIDLVKSCVSASDHRRLFETALPKARRLLRASTIVVEQSGPDGVEIAFCDGLEVPATGVAVAADGSRNIVVDPDPWHALGIDHVVSQRLAGHAGVLAVGWPTSAAVAPVSLEVGVALDLIASTATRIAAETELHDLTARVRSAQHLASMGDYDWHIASDTNTWSDELYRIYGFEPQAFNASYEGFLSNIHPDDRERVRAIHQQAYATGEAYSMIERIVRPDGEVRYLSSNGEVIMDEAGIPVRMRGTCIDVTERILAEQEREQVSERFRKLVEAAPEAILVVDADEQIVQANKRATALLGSDPGGGRLRDFLPLGAEGGEAVEGLGHEGQPLKLDVTVVTFKESERGDMTALFLADAAPRLEREAMAVQIGESQQRRRQALEINDNVVQGLSAAAYALEREDLPAAFSFVRRTLTSARHMMDDLLEPQGQVLGPGDLVRASAASLGPQPVLQARDEPEGTPPVANVSKVLIVDDAEDIRMLLRLKLAHHGEYQVVGEAEDGEDAIEKAQALQPDLVLLDMAMPRMDGLQALPLIRAAVPGVRIIVLSGFNQSTLEREALAAGADRYVVKGGGLQELLDVIADVLTT